MKYVVQSTAVMDSISYPGWEQKKEAPGGAGFYAMAGMKVWEDDVQIVTGVGADYLEHFGEWYDRNSVSTGGLIIKNAYTPRTIVRYDEEGERVEVPEYGAEHYHQVEANPEEVEAFCRGCVGMYVFKDTNQMYWNEMLSMKRRHEFSLMWEIAANATSQENQKMVREIAEQIDVLSINKTEAGNLFGTRDVQEAIKQFHSWNVPLVYLRMGSCGVYLLQGGRTVFVPSVPAVNVVDATGGGNSSSGGAMIGYCKGCALEEIGAMGNVAASFCIEQWGVPENFDTALREEAVRRYEQVLGLVKKEK